MDGKVGKIIVVFFLIFPLLGKGQYWKPLLNDTVVQQASLKSLTVRNDTLIASGGVVYVNGELSLGSFAWYEDAYFNVGPNYFGISTVNASEIYNNELFVCGSFSFDADDGLEYRSLGRWDGQNWWGANNLDLPDNTDGIIYCCETFEDLFFISGSIGPFAGEVVNRVATWDGESWSNRGGVAFGAFRDMTSHNDTLIGGGTALTQNSYGEPGDGLFYWDGDSTWHEYAGGVQGSVWSLTSDTIENYLYVGGNFTQVGGSLFTKSIARWDGSNWSALEPGVTFDGNVRSLCMYRNQLYASGLFEYIVRPGNDTLDVRNVMRFDGAHWQPMDGGIDGAAFDMMVYEDDLFLAGGILSVSADSIPVNQIVRWYMHPDSVTWGINVAEIDTQKPTQRFTLYPNPNSGEFYVEFEPKYRSQGQLVITNVQGKQVAIESIQNRKKVELFLEHLASGTYLCSLIEGGRIVETDRLLIY